MSVSTHQSLIDALARARRSGTTIEAPDSIENLAMAYAIQEAVSLKLGGTSPGWKVGSTSRVAQQRLGTSEPGAGRLLPQYTFDSGATIAISEHHDVQIEIEFAFVFAQPLIPRQDAYTVNDIRAAVGEFIPAIELVGSRYSSGLAGSGREAVTADGGANVAFVHGPPVAYRADIDLAAHPCSAWINGQQKAQGTGSNALDDPLNVLVWLANHLSGRGIALNRGDKVTTGTCTGLINVKAGDHIAGDFGPLGQVEATLSPFE